MPSLSPVAQMDIPQIVSAIGNGGVLVVIAALFIWFAYYRETRTIPTLMKVFSDGMSLAQTSFESRNKALVAAFEQQMDRERLSNEQQMDRERTVCQAWHEENRHKLDQVLVEIKEQRHLIRDFTHAARLKNAADELQIRNANDEDDTPLNQRK